MKLFYLFGYLLISMMSFSRSKRCKLKQAIFRFKCIKLFTAMTVFDNVRSWTKTTIHFLEKETCSHQINKYFICHARQEHKWLQTAPPSWLIEFIHNICVNRLSFPYLNSITLDFNLPPAPCRPTTNNV